MPKHVLFLCYHGVGHINPCFPLARILENQGHTVTLATVAHFGSYVRQAGFRHYSLNSVPFGLGFEAWVIATRKERLRYWRNLQARYNDRLFHERKQELTAMISDLSPDVIFIDGTQATDFIVLYHAIRKQRIAYAILHAMFPTHVLPGRPPVNSTVVPGDAQKEQHAFRLMQRKLNRADLIQRLSYFGMSDRFVINRRLTKEHIPTSFRTAIPSLFDFQTDQVPSFILAPRQFDFANFSNPAHFHYVGFLSHDAPPSGTDWSLVKASVQARRAAGSRLIYCSFGTVDSKSKRQIDKFLVRLADAVTSCGDQLVISIGAQRPAPPGLQRRDVWIFPSVPQREVLLDCDVFVTHGGLSSIKEAIEFVVPMLMIVVHQQFDPPGNAARVQYHGLGLIGDIDGSPENIRANLDILIEDNNFRDRLRKMNEPDKSLVAQRFLMLFDSLKA